MKVTPTFLSLALTFSLTQLASAPGQAQPVGKRSPLAGTVEVRGDLPKPGELKAADLEPLGAVTANWSMHGQAHTVVGVPVEKVLRRFGWDPGVMSKTQPPAEKRVGYKMVVVATAPDGFQAVFSAAELAEGMGKTQALVVWMVDGKPVSAAEGPLRLVVPSDAEPSRSLHNLTRLDVVDMRRIVKVTPPAK